MAKGWKNESRRHALASKGIKTSTNNVQDRVVDKEYTRAILDYGSSLTTLQKDRFEKLGFKASIVNDGENKIVFVQRIEKPYDIQKIRFTPPFIKSKINDFLKKNELAIPQKKDRVYKYGSYKGVKMEFIDEEGIVYARAFGIGVVGKGATKKEALAHAKQTITRKMERGNIYSQ